MHVYYELTHCHSIYIVFRKNTYLCFRL